MKKTAIAIAVALVGFATVAQVAPKSNVWCTDTKPGWPQFHDIGNSRINNNGSIHEGQLGTGAFGGHQVSPYAGFRMGYNQLDCMLCKGSEQNGALEVQGVQLTARLGYPVTDDPDVYTHLGGMVWRADAKNNDNFKDYDTGISPVLANGIEYAITPETATRLEYQWANNIGDTNAVGGCPGNDLLGVGVSYRFGQQEEATLVVIAPAPVPEVQTRHFILKSDVLFDFSKAVLKLEGQQAPDQMHNQLNNLDPKDGSVAVLGLIDRIGSDTYNQGLPEKRAQSVVDYPTSKGIPSDKISACGTGESDLVIGNVCDNVKARAVLVDCLAPDHHVEIEVKGIKGAVVQPQA